MKNYSANLGAGLSRTGNNSFQQGVFDVIPFNVFPSKKISHPYYLFTQSFVAWLFLFCCSVNAFAQTAQISNPIGSNQSTIPQFSAVASSLVAGVTYNVAISESPRGGVGNQYIDWWVKQGVTVNDLLPTNANRLTWSSGWTRNIRSGGYDGAVTSSTLGSPASLTPGKTYYWHIVGTNGTKSAQASFTVMSLPAQPALTISHNLNRNLFEISWNSVSNVSRYELYRSNSLIYSGMATSQSVPIISAGVSYPFLLKACNAAGCTNGSSSTGNFPVPPATAIIQSPAVGGTASTIPLFAATTASLVSTASYTLAISESPRAGLNGQYVDYWSLGGLSSSALIAGNAGQTSWNTNWVQRTRNGNPDGAATIVSNTSPPALTVSNTSPPALTVGKTYYWHIVASGSNGGLSKSAEGRFVVGAAASSSIGQISSSSSSMSAASVQSKTIRYTYDALGRLTFVEDSQNGNRDYDYDAAGNRLLVSTGTANDAAVEPSPIAFPAPANPYKSLIASCAWKATWSPVAGATKYQVSDTSGASQWVTVTEAYVECPVGNSSGNMPKSVQACDGRNVCGTSANF